MVQASLPLRRTGFDLSPYPFKPSEGRHGPDIQLPQAALERARRYPRCGPRRGRRHDDVRGGDGRRRDGDAPAARPAATRFRWICDGPDKIRDSLLEDSGNGLKPLAEWDFVRVNTRTKPNPPAAENAVEPLPACFNAFGPLLGQSWETKGKFNGGPSDEAEIYFLTTYWWDPLLEVVCIRVVEPINDGEPAHVLDAYIYRHVRNGALRCLALSSRGGVYEGDVTFAEAGAIRFALKGYEGDRVVSMGARLEPAQDGTWRHRGGAVDGTEHTLRLDIRHTKAERERH